MKDQRALLNKCIQDDIPAIVISAKDICALPVIGKYLEEAKKQGCDFSFIEDFKEVQKAFESYQRENSQQVEVPDLGRTHMKVENVHLLGSFRPLDAPQLESKLDHLIRKLNSDTAVELINTATDNVKNVLSKMSSIARLNMNVKRPYMEFTLSFPPGQHVSNDTFSQLAKEYMKEMGYEKAAYTAIRDMDKPTVHILATTIDREGKAISNYFATQRSSEVCKRLENKFGVVNSPGSELQELLKNERLAPLYREDMAAKNELPTNKNAREWLQEYRTSLSQQPANPVKSILTRM